MKAIAYKKREEEITGLHKVDIIFTVLLFGFIFLIFLPPIIGLEGMDGGFAVRLVSLFLAISSLIVAIIYFQLILIQTNRFLVFLR